MGPYLRILAAFAADMFGRFRRWLTLRRVLWLVGFLVLLMSLPQFMAMGADVSFLFGLDFGLIAEVSALMIILSVRDRVMSAVYLLRRALHQLRTFGGFIRRSAWRAVRTRSARPLLPPPPEDEPAWAFA